MAANGARGFPHMGCFAAPEVPIWPVLMDQADGSAQGGSERVIRQIVSAAHLLSNVAFGSCVTHASNKCSCKLVASSCRFTLDLATEVIS